MNLNDRKWEEFIIGKTFKVSGTTTTHPSKLINGGKVPRVTCSSLNNGLDTVYLNSATEQGGVLTIESATVGYISYQKTNFIATDHVEKVYLEDRTINENLGLGLASLLKNATLNKFNYGYKFSQDRIKKQKIIMPVKSKEKPDYEYIEKYTKLKINKKLDEYKKHGNKVLRDIKYKRIPQLNKKKWLDFFIEDIATISSGRDIYEKERIIGNTPYVSSTSANNGISYFVSNINNTLERNCISVNRNGSVGYSFFHPYSALISNDCRKLVLKEHSNYVALFITNQITMQKEKYNYGYKMGTGRLKRQKILLPINDDDNPDFKYMEQYIKNMMYIKIKKYLDYIDKKANL